MNYPCWSRGLIAVNMYYEGQHALISALHAMVRLTPGLTWGSRVSHKLIDIVKPFLENLYADNLIDKVLGNETESCAGGMCMFSKSTL